MIPQQYFEFSCKNINRDYDFKDTENGYEEWYDTSRNNHIDYKFLKAVNFDDGELRIYNSNGTFESYQE